MNTKNIIVICVILVIAVATGIVLLFTDNNTAPTSHDNTTPATSTEEIPDTVSGEDTTEYEELTFPNNTLDTSDWVTYRNEEFGFEVKHPPEWGVENELNKYSRLIFWPGSGRGPDDRGTYMYISDKALEEFLQDVNKNPKDFKFASRFIHNGVPGIIIDAKLGVWEKNYPFPDEREIIQHYIFDIGTNRITFYNPSTNDIFESTFEQIVTSFKLIK